MWRHRHAARGDRGPLARGAVVVVVVRGRRPRHPHAHSSGMPPVPVPVPVRLGLVRETRVQMVLVRPLRRQHLRVARRGAAGPLLWGLPVAVRAHRPSATRNRGGVLCVARSSRRVHHPTRARFLRVVRRRSVWWPRRFGPPLRGRGRPGLVRVDNLVPLRCALHRLLVALKSVEFGRRFTCAGAREAGEVARYSAVAGSVPSCQLRWRQLFFNVVLALGWVVLRWGLRVRCSGHDPGLPPRTRPLGVLWRTEIHV
mmetsp:Transcript_3354/g.10292  ORF Transcript_3354/g.10292 Transcript_3354/m.10292 type:complete len:256 (-) Transcript_3354:244-1011(-)